MLGIYEQLQESAWNNKFSVLLLFAYFYCCCCY